MDPEHCSPDEKRAALADLLRQRAARPKTFPLSFAQQRVWYAQQLDPDNPFFNLAVAMRLVGDLDPAALAWALSEIVRRHEALRTVFVVVDSLPLQSVTPARPPRRNPSRHALVQVMFGFRNSPVPGHEMPGPTASFLEFETGLARFDLELILWEEGLEIQGTILYNVALSRARTAARLVEQGGAAGLETAEDGEGPLSVHGEREEDRGEPGPRSPGRRRSRHGPSRPGPP